MTFGASPPLETVGCIVPTASSCHGLLIAFAIFISYLKLALISTAQIEYCPLCPHWSWIDEGEKEAIELPERFHRKTSFLRRHYLPDAGALLLQVLRDRQPRDAIFFINLCSSTEGDVSLQSSRSFAVWISWKCFSFLLYLIPFHPKNNVQQAPNIPSGSESSKQTWLACQIGLDSVRMLGRIESTRGNCGRQRAEANADMIVFINKGSVTRKMDF